MWLNSGMSHGSDVCEYLADGEVEHGNARHWRHRVLGSLVCVFHRLEDQDRRPDAIDRFQPVPADDARGARNERLSGLRKELSGYLRIVDPDIGHDCVHGPILLLEIADVRVG
jgi:hypothetical protein